MTGSFRLTNRILNHSDHIMTGIVYDSDAGDLRLRFDGSDTGTALGSRSSDNRIVRVDDRAAQSSVFKPRSAAAQRLS